MSTSARWRDAEPLFGARAALLACAWAAAGAGALWVVGAPRSLCVAAAAALAVHAVRRPLRLGVLAPCARASLRRGGALTGWLSLAGFAPQRTMGRVTLMGTDWRLAARPSSPASAETLALIELLDAIAAPLLGEECVVAVLKALADTLVERRFQVQVDEDEAGSLKPRAQVSMGVRIVSLDVLEELFERELLPPCHLVVCQVKFYC